MTAIPSNVQPPHQGLVLTDYPELQAYVQYADSVQETGIMITWQIATDALFTADLQQISTPERLSSGEVATASVTTRLSAQTWYIRAKATDGAGVESGWTGTNIFTIDHRPSVSNMSPAHGSKVAYGVGDILFSWAFSDFDPSDVQTAYQIQAFHAGNDALLFDTGKINSSVKSHTQAIAPANSTGYFYWQIRVWDFYDIDSPWTDPTLFRMGVNPTALILAPENMGAVGVPAPTIQWAFSTSNSPGATYASLSNAYPTYNELQLENASYTDVVSTSLDQAGQTHYRITIRDLSLGSLTGLGFLDEVARTPDPFGPATIFDSGWLAGTASTHQIPAIIHVGETYEVTVSVRDNSDFEGSSTPVRFGAQWAAPDSPLALVVDTSVVDDPSVGAVQVTWNAASYDPTFSHWRCYNRIKPAPDSAGTPWKLVGESTDQSGRAEVFDYLFESGRVYEYGVTQVAARYFDEKVESPLTKKEAQPDSTKYWLIHASDSTYTLMLNHVVSDSFTEEYEVFDDQIIGRGRRMEIGTRWGYKGTLTLHLRDLDERGSSLELAEILAFRAERSDAFLRVPFGHIWKVALGDIGFSRMGGVGAREFGEVTIPYSEVI